jgi:hypothetical protein
VLTESGFNIQRAIGEVAEDFICSICTGSTKLLNMFSLTTEMGAKMFYETQLMKFHLASTTSVGSVLLNRYASTDHALVAAALFRE